MNLLLHQSIPVPSRMCVNLVHFTWLNPFCQSTKHTHNSSMSSVCSDIILSIPFASLVPLLNQNWSSPSASSIFFSFPLLSILVSVFVVCTVRLIAWWLLHCVAFGFFWKAIMVTSVKSLSTSSVFCILLISCVTILRLFSPISWVHLQLHHHLL